MPSIYEVPITEASWVAPNLRSTNTSKQGVERGMRKRRKINTDPQKQPQAPTPENPDAGSSTPAKNKRGALATFALTLGQRTVVRTAINGVLLALILHLLLLPEFIYQAQGLCNLPGVKSIYPNSCILLHPQPSPRNPPHPIAPEETISASQAHLESILTSSLTTLTPLAHILKESESMLQDLHYTLKSRFPDARHALALEFKGSDQALRTATWEFDSLRADLRSAIDSILASPPAQEPTGSSIARDTRLAAQIRRRAEYLDRLRAQIRGKTDSLSTRFNTLDDHLEAVDGIVSREERRASLAGTGFGSGGSDGLQSVLDSLSRYTFGTKLFGEGSTSRAQTETETEETEVPRPATTLAMLRFAATHHLPVADSVVRLSRQLRDMQRARGSTWVGYE